MTMRPPTEAQDGDPSASPSALEDFAPKQGSSAKISANKRHGRGGVAGLAIGAVGVVFGDIGTSPLYAFRETFGGDHPIDVDNLHIYGVLSLVFWSMMMVVTFKYVLTIMRADNKGEGGSLALLALINSKAKDGRWHWLVVMLGLFATALFYGDSMITPAMSVLSATEGLSYVDPRFDNYIIPIALAILIGLFSLQSRGTARVGALFGPIMLCYFLMLSVLGVIHIIDHPVIILHTLNPLNALRFFWVDGFFAFVALGAVVLAVTGAEALYTDMGHFGRAPIRISWLFFVLPALMLNYMGQGAMVLSASNHVEAAVLIKDPFFLMMSDSWRTPVVLLALLATIIASQAVISGAFSLTQQAIQLGFMPRLRIAHTSAHAAGQIYIPAVNWFLMTMVVLLVLFFGSSSNLAAAYGVAVTGAMFIDSCLMSVVVFLLWRWPMWKALPMLAAFFIVDMAYLGANLIKVPDGGWVPLAIGLVIFTMLTSWSRGRKLMQQEMAKGGMPIPLFIESAAGSATRVSGTAIFMTSSPDSVPPALLHNLKHNKILHERVVFLTIETSASPYVDAHCHRQAENFGCGFYRLILHYGFMETVDVPRALEAVSECGGSFRMIETSFFLSRETLVAAPVSGMPFWREKLFAWMLRNSESAMEYFRLPNNRVVELGSQISI